MSPLGSGIRLIEISAFYSTPRLEVLVEDTSFKNHLISEQIYNAQTESGVITVYCIQFETP